MLSFHAWAEKNHLAEEGRPWLLLGKGPSFSKRDQYDLSQFRLLSINHVVREQTVDVAHVIDLDVVLNCPEAFLENAEVLVMPWIPHVDNWIGKKNLGQLAEEIPALNEMNRQGRLLFYNLSTAKTVKDGSPVIHVKYFSTVAALGLLASAGIKQVRSLGIDGGTNYSTKFDDLADKTLLNNKWSSFDKQFKEFARIIVDTNIDFAPLDIESPVRVYVATMEDQMLAVKVLEYSIKKNTSMSVEVYPMHLSDIPIPVPKEVKNRARTPFSFQRFLIPELTGFKGRAIYLDSDMQVFKDIKDLWCRPFDKGPLLAVKEPVESGRKPQFSVMLLDCSTLKWNVSDIVQSLDDGKLTYENLMYEMAIVDQVDRSIDSEWNSLEKFEEGRTALLHYTDMTTQPWIYSANPLGYVWVRDLIEAVETGFIDYDYVREQVDSGAVRPSLLYQLDHKLADGLLLPKKAKQMDKGFRAPYKQLHNSHASPWLRKSMFVKAVIRHFYHKSGASSLVRRIQEKIHK